MSSLIKFALRSTVALIAIAPLAAYAQDSSPSQEGAEDVRPNDIVVSARKTKETLQDTPLAVSVITGEMLERTGFTQVTEIARFVPGIAIAPLNTARATGTKIRGISTFSFSDGFESSVSTVVDGVVLGREAQGFSDFLDIQSIEVIKGPQGTLFGKNASAGVINIQTNDPKFELGGNGDISYGSYNAVKLRGTVTGPISDKVAVRLTGTYSRRDGVLENAIPGEPDINNRESWMLRGKILFNPIDDLTIKLTGDIGRGNGRCCLPTFRVAGANSGAIPFATNTGVLQLRSALAAYGIMAGPGNRQVAVRGDRIGEKTSAGGLALNMDYTWGDTTLTSITAWRQWDIDEFNEADGVSNSNLNDRNGTAVQTQQFSQELRLNGDGGKVLDYVLGLYYFNQNLDAQGRVDIGFGLPFPPYFNVRTTADRRVSTESLAAFGELTFNVTDKASLIFGGRYTHDVLSANYKRRSVALNPAAPTAPFFGADVTGFQVVRNDNFSGRIIGRYFWTDDLMTYVSWSRGYKGPGIDVAESVNVAAITTPGGLPVLPPEIPSLWEAGFRSAFFDKALTVNVTAYDQQVRNLQTITSNSVGATLNLSIDKIKSRGIEAEVILRPAAIPGLTLSGAYTLNDVTIDNFAARPDLKGKRFRDNAHDFYSIVGDYRFPITQSGFGGFARAEWAWQSAKNTDLNGGAFANVDSYGLLNLRVGVNAPEDRYGLTFSVENVTNKVYANYILRSSYSSLDGATSAQFIGDPRTWKVSFHAKF